MKLHFLDTNILLYSISTAEKDQLKRSRSLALLSKTDGALSTQVLQEFYVQATRPSRTPPLSHRDALDLVLAWSRFTIQEINLSLILSAMEIRERYRFSYWDSAILAAARSLGCRTLYTEDLRHGQELEGMVILNPFL